MSPHEIQIILDRLTRIEAKLDTQGDALGEISIEVKKTNGRVTSLETREAQDRARLDERTAIENATAARNDRYIPPFLVGVGVVVVGTLVLVLLGVKV
jgi:hypothetical protein